MPWRWYLKFNKVVRADGTVARYKSRCKKWIKSNRPYKPQKRGLEKKSIWSRRFGLLELYNRKEQQQLICPSGYSISQCFNVMGKMWYAYRRAKENRALLIGEAMSKKDHSKIIECVVKIPEVNRIISLRTMHFGPNDVLVAMEVSLIDNINTDQIEQVIDTIEDNIKSVIDVKTSSKIYVEAHKIITAHNV